MKIFASCFLVGLAMCMPSQPLMAICTKENHCHADKKIVRCLYSQKDLERIRKKNKKRLKEMNIDKKECFYCGCKKDDHSQE